MDAQRLPNLRVRARHRHRGPGPVANVPPSCREHLDRAWLGAIEHGRQIADHAAWTFSQSHLNCLIQLLDDVSEPARDLQYRYLTYRAFSELSPTSRGRAAGWPSWGLGWAVGPMLAWGRNEEAVVPWEKVVLMAQSVKDRETRFGGPGMLRTRATEGLEQRGETGATEGLGRTQQHGPYARYTPKTYDLGHCPPSTAASE
jgi:hypothetical protein